jgi:excisionase family DNA binding protein
MQVESTRLYRVRAVAEALDVSVATIYRAVESGALRAVRMGTGKGAVRIPGQAVRDYLAACESAAATAALRVPRGHACRTCGFTQKGRPVGPTGAIKAETDVEVSDSRAVETADSLSGGVA